MYKLRAPSIPRATLAALLLCAAAPCHATERSAAELVELINEFRSNGQACGGSTNVPAGPLAPDARLLAGSAVSGRGLIAALKVNGYQAERVQLLEVSGPGSAEATLQVLLQKDCRALANPRDAAIGVSRQGNRWRIVLARPLLSPDLAESPQAGRQILELVNEARSQPRRCGDRGFGSAAALTWNNSLAGAAREHSRQMADGNFFSHLGKRGSTVAQRTDAAGYPRWLVGENIASGQGSTIDVVAAWLASPQHCANIMDPRFSEMGAAYAVNPASDATIYWTQVLGTPR